ncbi:MAG TPA: 1,4-alpha-glucan branching protein domain-containing protein [Tepidisphaeraceae bacterium]|nr:1,4-alpha-glucan branching protein domain-containing protein [Tepidisphaeraceae bacterium]
MSESLGSLCIVLHGHLPYVLNHGVWPHGEAWLYEAAAETYLPLLDMIGEVALHRARPGLTIGLTPVLLEQLAQERFKAGFIAYLHERMEHAARDHAVFERDGQKHFAYLAGRWEKWYAARLADFQRIDCDIVGQFAARRDEGHVQLLGGPATHAYLPLLLTDECIRAQMSAGALAGERHLREKPRGMWLPECGYRPAQEWKPPVLYDDLRPRAGIETFVAGAGADHFFIDSHQVADAQPLGTLEAGVFCEAGEAQIYWDKNRPWRSPMQPVGVASFPQVPDCFALARHPRVSEQVWSGAIGYPGSGEYLDFHRRNGPHGLRYHRVTDVSIDLAQKQPYFLEDTFGKLYEHSQHFCRIVRDALAEYKREHGRPGVVVAPFDAELFGHWWFEGPRFLRDVIFTLSRDKSVQLATAAEVLEQHPPQTVVRLPEGSWGKEGDHSVWLNDQTRWIWEVEYRAEGRMLQLLRDLPWKENADVRGMLERAGRELLLLQASDWPFVIHSKGAVDYGIQRFSLHATRFERMANIAEQLAGGRPIDALQKSQVDEADAHDVVFANIDLNWWA